MSKPSVRTTFPTPILVWENAGLPAFNEQLLKIVTVKQQSSAASNQVASQIGGWSSGGDALQWEYPAIDALKKTISAGIREMINTTKTVEAKPAPLFMRGWFSVMHDGAYSRQETYHPAAYTGIYYVQAGDQTEDERWSGAVQFIDPRTGVGAAEVPGNPFVNKVRVLPKDGLLLIFPGWLRHVIYPYSGTKEQVSLCFNIEFGQERDSEGH